METQTLHFWTTGEAYTNLLLDLFKSGEFHAFEQSLQGGNFEEEQMRLAFNLQLELTGTTKDGGDLSAHFLQKQPEDFKDILYYAISTALNAKRKEYREWSFLDLNHLLEKQDKDFIALCKHISIEEIYSKYYKAILKEEGFEVRELKEAMDSEERTISGLILTNGEFVQCGYQDHRSLYPVLLRLGLIKDGGDSHLSCDAIAISSNMLCGGQAYCLQNRSFSLSDRDSYFITDEQVKTLWSVRDKNLRYYSSSSIDNPVNDSLREWICRKNNRGGKYGNLAFLREFYPHIKTVDFYEDCPSLEAGRVFIRTSPRYSLPGLLNSILISNKEEKKQAIETIEKEFDKFKDLRHGNRLYWFYQYLLEGQNGVVNCIEKHVDHYPKPGTLLHETILRSKYDITIACSEVQGNIVKGKSGDYKLSPDEQAYLRRLSRELADDFQLDVQLEFVRVAENDIRIVQMRTLQNKPRTSFSPSEEELLKAIVVGKTFSAAPYYSHNNIEVNIENILIVEEDCESEKLLGKHALIVTGEPNFSHILALSKALNIPSIYATGPVDFTGVKTVRFSTEYMEGYIKVINN